MSYYSEPRKPFTKADAQKLHAMRRAAERYNVEVKVPEIVKMIQTGRARHLRKQSNRLSIFRLIYKSVEMDCVYDRKRKTVVTFLPRKDQMAT